MPKISVIVPIYNVEQYLDKCLNSLICQTLNDIEIICIDDCSPDNSYGILQKYANQDKRIKVIRNKKTCGIATSRNNGLKVAKSPYIMFCDSDDWFEPNMCERMLYLITKNKAELGLCSANVIYETDTSLKNTDKKLQLTNGCFDIQDPITKKFTVSVWSRIIKHKIIKDNDIKFPDGLMYEDVYFSTVYNLHTKKVATTAEKLYNYRRRNGSTMNTTFIGKSNMSIDQAKIAFEYFKYLKHHKLYKQEYYNFWTELFVSCAQNALMFTKNEHYRQKLNEMLTDFVSKNYVFGTTNSRTDNIILLIIEHKFMHRQKYLGGIFQIYHEAFKTEYCMGKISTFKIKYTDTHKKYYLFGLCLYKKVNK